MVGSGAANDFGNAFHGRIARGRLQTKGVAKWCANSSLWIEGWGGGHFVESLAKPGEIYEGKNSNPSAVSDFGHYTKNIYIMEGIYAQYEYKLIFYHKIKIMSMLNLHIIMFIQQGNNWIICLTMFSSSLILFLYVLFTFFMNCKK